MELFQWLVLGRPRFGRAARRWKRDRKQRPPPAGKQLLTGLLGPPQRELMRTPVLERNVKQPQARRQAQMRKLLLAAAGHSEVEHLLAQVHQHSGRTQLLPWKAAHSELKHLLQRAAPFRRGET